MSTLAVTLSLPRARFGRAAALALAAAVLLVAIAALRFGTHLSTLVAMPGTPAAELAAIFAWQLELPRVLAALLAGAALGVAGALFQALTRNPLAAPDLLGVSGGAQLGVFAVMMVPALAGAARVPLLFGCGLGAAALALCAAGGWRAAPLRLILAGTACSLLFGAVVNMLLTLFEESIAGVALWGNGSLYQPGAGGLATAALWALPALVALPWLLKPLEVTQLGDDAAHAIGVPLVRLRLATVAVATLLAAIAVALAGPLGFVGLLAPNLLRAAGVLRLRVLLPLGALWGALLLVATDTLVVGLGLDNEISTGVMIALIGTPALLVLIQRQQGLYALNAGGTEVAPARRLPLPALAGSIFVLLALLAWWAASAGLEWLSPARIVAALGGHDPVAALLLELRLPRFAVALVAGCLLAASGTLLQSVVKNPLAGPEVLGITQGAALAVLLLQTVAPLAGRGPTFGAAFAGGGATLAVLLLLNRRHRFAPLPLALTGIALGALCTALANWLIVATGVQPARFLVWLIGGTYGRSLVDLAVLAPWFAAALPALLLLARPLDLIALGDDNAAALGVPVARLRLLALVLATLLACAAVAVVGPVAFVGLMTPHLARLLGFTAFGPRLVVAMLLGALLLGAADIAGRLLLAPVELPAGVASALIGAPYLIVLLIAGAKRGGR